MSVRVTAQDRKAEALLPVPDPDTGSMVPAVTQEAAALDWSAQFAGRATSPTVTPTKIQGPERSPRR